MVFNNRLVIHLLMLLLV